MAVWQAPRQCKSAQTLLTTLMDPNRVAHDRKKLDKRITRSYRALKACAASNPDYVQHLDTLAYALVDRFLHSGNPEDLMRAMVCHREAVGQLPAEHPHRSRCIVPACITLLSRLSFSGLEAKIHYYRTALGFHSPGDIYRAHSLTNLGAAIYQQITDKLWVTREEIDEAIHVLREALALHPPPHPDRHISLIHLSNALNDQFMHLDKIPDLDATIDIHREALYLAQPPHPRRDSILNNLGYALFHRFQETAQDVDVEEAIRLLREAVALRPPPHRFRAMSINNLALAIEGLFNSRGKPGDLDEAIEMHRESLALRSPSTRGFALANLASSLTLRFHHRGGLDDIDQAIRFHDEVLSMTPPGHPHRATVLGNLAQAIYDRGDKKSANRDDNDRAIAYSREALAPLIRALEERRAWRCRQCGEVEPRRTSALPAQAPGSARILRGLGEVLRERFEFQGQRDDIDEAIQLHREALAMCPLSNGDRGASILRLAHALAERSMDRGHFGDADEALELGRAALALIPAHLIHPRKQCLLVLALILHLRFKYHSRDADIDESINLLREALTFPSLLVGERALYLSNLAACIEERSTHKGTIDDDINEAIKHLGEALSLSRTVDEVHGLELYISNNLANALRQRFLAGRGDPADLERAADLLRGAVASCPEQHPFRCLYLRNLGHCLITLHESKRLDALEEAISAFREGWSCTSAFITDRFKRKLGPDAAACAIRMGEYNLAVEFLEAGRAVFWAQALRLRTPLDDLRVEYPRMAASLAELAANLERRSFPDSERLPSSAKQAVSMDAQAMNVRHLEDAWNRTVESVRRLPGFANFMRPRTMRELRCAALHGPVVVLNAGEHSAHALVVTFGSETVQCVPLPGMTWDLAYFLLTMTRKLSQNIPVDFKSLATDRRSVSRGLPDHLRTVFEDRLTGGKEKQKSSNEEFAFLLEILWELIAAPVVRELKLVKSETPPRLWWCPTGPFTFLPIHAAGITRDGTSEAMSDYVVSSYTPTITTLLVPEITRPTPNNPFNVVAVIQPDTPDHSSLPKTIEELLKMQEKIPPQWLTGLGMPPSSVSVKTVLSHLRTASVVHFACHGTQRPHNPLDSALLISSEHLTVSNIMQNSGTSAEDTSIAFKRGLVFLSACETATGDDELPDESMHLASTLLFAGFRSAVATMWTMQDSDGPAIAEAFYGHLFRDANAVSNPPVLPNLTESAHALHLAVAKLKPHVPFSRWVKQKQVLIVEINIISIKNATTPGADYRLSIAGFDFSSFFSPSALKIVVIGAVVEAVRRLAFFLYYKIIASFWITAHFDEDDSSYDWMMVWLSKQPAWSQAREVEISTSSFGLATAATQIPGEDETDLSRLSTRKLAYLPAPSLTYSMWYHRRYVSVTRIQTQTGRRGQKEESLCISILARHHRVLNELLLEAKKIYMTEVENCVSIYVSDSSNNWSHVGSRPKRPITYIILDPGVAELLVDDARDFLESKACELISNLPEKCIALMEDIDAAFTHTLNRDEQEANDEAAAPGAHPAPPTSRLSLSGLLNALDGVAAQEGRILYATTNKYTSLDPALIRPGRLDIHVEFKLASKLQAQRLFCAFFLPEDDANTDVGASSASPIPVPASPIRENEKPIFFGTSHRHHAPKLRRTQVADLAARFAEAIPEREVSMAALQGYLMTHKIRPFEAVDAAREWVESERELARTRREGSPPKVEDST
ncbi:BCS1 N terminal-domain-containing protein [Mycena epipterygia]|nr:BCS1 N terminal-domain-containing protein [Mycena epipterygia]